MASGDMWSVVDVTVLGSGRTFTAEVRHPAELIAELEPEEVPQYWYLQTMNMLDSLLRRLGNVRMVIEIAYLPDVARDLMRMAP